MFKHDLGDGADLRIFDRAQASAFVTLVQENRDYFGAWLDWAYNINTIEAAEAFIKRGMNRYTEDGLPMTSIWLHNRMVGGVMFFPVEWHARSTMIGYWLSQDATGQGVMSRAIKAMLGFAFDDLHLNRITLEAEVNNRPSRAVAERVGFAFEGVHRHGWVRGGNFVDLAAYAMLASDWQKIKAER
ncbi:MAG TPA: GNAT family protein [Herpetosiphonaceae bacterium]